MPGPVAPEFFIEQDRPHLGGYIVGGDPATYFPDLWKWLVTALGVRSVIDVGCGEGRALDYFREELDCSVVGIDGVTQGKASILAHDYTTGPLPNEDNVPFIPRADLVWSCEFVEHVEEQFIPNFLATFRRADLVLMTHAEPGQPGHHHVNCQPAAYWIGAMAAVGFRYDDALTRGARAMATLNWNQINHFARSGLAFRRQP